jgi:putative transcriptional regulator
MGMKYIIDVLSALKNAGYSTYRLRKETIFNDSTVSKFRNNQTDISVKTLETLCKLLDCQPGDILEYVPGSPDKEAK